MFSCSKRFHSVTGHAYKHYKLAAHAYFTFFVNRGAYIMLYAVAYFLDLTLGLHTTGF